MQNVSWKQNGRIFVKRGFFKTPAFKNFIILATHTCDKLRYMLLETGLYSCMIFLGVFNVAVCLMLGFTKPDSLENGFFFFFNLNRTYRGKIKGKKYIKQTMCANICDATQRLHIENIPPLSLQPVP